MFIKLNIKYFILKKKYKNYSKNKKFKLKYYKLYIILTKILRF